MVFQKEHLDLFLVPSGLLILFAYHFFLLQRYIKNPHTTVFGFENNDKIAWIQKIMQVSNNKSPIIPLKFKRSWRVQAFGHDLVEI